MDKSPVSLRAYVRLIKSNRNFRRLWYAQIVSEIGDWLYAVALYSLLLEFTGKAQSIALAFVMQVLPQFFISPSAGILNDRVSRKKIMVIADWGRTVIVLCMVFVRTPAAVPLLYFLLLLETVLWAFFEPGRSAVIPNIVEEPDVVTANSLSSVTWSFNFAMGFSLGGVLAATFGRDAVFALNALSFVLSALLISRMRFNEPHALNSRPFRWKDLFDYSPIREGAVYVWQHPQLRSTIFVKAGLGLMGANWVLLPLFGVRVFHVHPEGFSAAQSGMVGMSVLMACRGIGALVGPLLGSYWAGSRQDRMRSGILIGFVCAAAGYVLLGFSPSLVYACGAVALAHSGGSMLWVFSATILQLQTDDRFRGRVFSTEFGLSVITMTLSSSVAGLLIDRSIPVRQVAIAVGCVMLVPALAWARVLSASPQSAA